MTAELKTEFLEAFEKEDNTSLKTFALLKIRGLKAQGEERLALLREIFVEYKYNFKETQFLLTGINSKFQSEAAR